MRDYIDASTRLLPTKHDNGSFPSITEYGCYDLYYLLEEFREEFPCCPMCATALTRGEEDYEGPIVTAVAINYETKNLYCEACNKKLGPEYGDTEGQPKVFSGDNHKPYISMRYEQNMFHLVGEHAYCRACKSIDGQSTFASCLNYEDTELYCEKCNSQILPIVNNSSNAGTQRFEVGDHVIVQLDPKNWGVSSRTGEVIGIVHNSKNPGDCLYNVAFHDKGHYVAGGLQLKPINNRG